MRVASKTFGIASTVAGFSLLAALVLILLFTRDPSPYGTAGLALAAATAFGLALGTVRSQASAELGADTAAVHRDLDGRDTQSLSRDQLDLVLHSLNEAIFFVGPNGLVQEANSAAGELLGQDVGSLVGADMNALLTANERRRVSRQESWRQQEAVVRRADGSLISVSYTTSEVHDTAGKLLAQVYAVQNIHERKQAEKRIRNLTRIDSLTKMANRMQIQHLLQQAITRARRDRGYIAILYLDVDRFKDINATFGHAAGDSSLETFAQRIADALPQGAVPGRLSGDEFCVLLPASARFDALIDEVDSIGKQLLHAVGRPFQVQGEEIFMSTSIGAAIYPRDGETAVELLRNAEAALYQAKKAGGNCIEFYSGQLAQASEERLMLKSKLRRAFERDELRLDYQPKYRISDGRIAGVEALIRWDLPQRGIVLPSDFIPIAEESNLILQLGEWVLDRVCADFREWQRALPSPCRVSLNLSLRQLQQQRFLEGFRKTFKRHSVSPTCFELEITETTLMHDVHRTIRVLDALYGMGLNLAIDDFGTGYSSLSALQQFPISTLKIDRSFVRDIEVDRDNATIVRTIIRMARTLKLDVVAEGVENRNQLDFLRANGCDIVQGHLFGDPMSADAFRDLLIADAEGSGRYQALFG